MLAGKIKTGKRQNCGWHFLIIEIVQNEIEVLEVSASRIWEMVNWVTELYLSLSFLLKSIAHKNHVSYMFSLGYFKYFVVQ